MASSVDPFRLDPRSVRHAFERAAATYASERSLFARLLGTRASARRDPRLVCGDVCHLPLASGTVDLVWSNLTLQWINDAAAAFGEFHRVLRAGGLLMFTTFGPDT